MLFWPQKRRYSLEFRHLKDRFVYLFEYLRSSPRSRRLSDLLRVGTSSSSSPSSIAAVRQCAASACSQNRATSKDLQMYPLAKQRYDKSAPNAR